MTTLVLAEEIEEVEAGKEIERIKTVGWSYRMPCAGVRYYTYEPELSPAEQIDPIG